MWNPEYIFPEKQYFAVNSSPIPEEGNKNLFNSHCIYIKTLKPIAFLNLPFMRQETEIPTPNAQ